MTVVAPLRRADRYGFQQAARAELIKISSLRSMILTAAVALVGSLAVTALATSTAGHHSAQWYQGFDPTNQSLTGLALAVLAIGVLGAMVATGEYATGTIRSTLSSAPRRPTLLVAKIAVVGGIGVALGELITFSCFGLGQAILAGGHAPTAALTQPGVFRAVALSGVFLGLLGLLALGLGVMIRHTAGAISSYVGVTILVPFLLSRLAYRSGRFSPVLILANSVSSVRPQGDQVTWPVGMLLMFCYSAFALVVAAILLSRRDA